MSEEKPKEGEKKPEIVVRSTEETKKGGIELEKVESKTDSSIKNSS
jgi:hypothetical protein